MANFSLKTKVNYHRSSKRTVYGRIAVFILVALILLALFGGFLGTVSMYASMPVYKMRHWIFESSASVPSYFRERGALIAEIRALENQIALSGGTEGTIGRLAAENEELREQLSIHSDDRIVAGVAARPPFLPYDTLLIDRGSKDGILQNAIVYQASDVAIGFISRVFHNSALVTLFSTPGVEATTYMYGPNIYTTAYGEGGGIIRISVPQGISVEMGDIAVLPSLEVGMLGKIGEIKSVPTDPEQHGYIMQNPSLQSLRLVSVSTRVLEDVSYEEAEKIIQNNNYGPLSIDVPEIINIDTEFATGTDVLGTENVESATSTVNSE